MQKLIMKMEGWHFFVESLDPGA